MRSLIIILLLTARAAALEYEVPIEIEREDDLYELRASEQISDDTLEALLELLHRGVDLDTADVAEIYALPGLTMRDAQAIVAYRGRDLVAAGVLSEEKLRAIRPFLAQKAPPLSATGWVRAQTLFSPDDDRVPTAALELRLTAFEHLTVGASLLLQRNQVSDVRWDPGQAALSADAPAPGIGLSKAFAEWRAPGIDVLVGNFRAGFGQRLVFDDTALATPNGFYADELYLHASDFVRGCVESAPACSGPLRYVTPDLRARDGLLGVAASARQISIGEGWLEVTAFLSREVHDPYQYDVAGSIAVVRRPTASHFIFQTLPDMWAEPLAGGNLSYFFDRRSHVGATGYGATADWLVGGAKLDFADGSSWPAGGPYGAVGLDAAWGGGPLDLGIELARSFDSKLGGDFGAVARATVSWPRNELELTLRTYGTDFANPYAGSVAEPDMLDGQRARDELGARLRFAGRVTESWQLSGLVDGWLQPSTGIPKLRAEARADRHFGESFLGAYLRWEDKDLRSGGICYDSSAMTDDTGQSVPCTGQKIDLGLVARLALAPRLSVTLLFQDRYLDDPSYPDSFRQDLVAWLGLAWTPSPVFHLEARGRFLDESAGDAASGETSLWAYAAAELRPHRAFTLRVRYDAHLFLDDRPSTALRTPDPEHAVRVEVESRF